MDAVLRFARESGPGLASPAALHVFGSPTPAAERGARGERRALVHALLGDDEATVTSLLLGRRSAGVPLDRIADELLAPALAEIGERWAEHRAEIYEERRACELIHRCLRRMGDELVPVAADAPRAIGGTLDGDPFTLPSALVELVLRERGFDARSLGPGLPGATFSQAVLDHAPRLVWIAVGAVPDAERFVEAFDRVADAVEKKRAALVVGGRGLAEGIRSRLRYAAFCDGMGQLAAFAEALRV